MTPGRISGRLPSLLLAIVAAGYVWLAYRYDFASRSLPWIAGVLAMTLALIDVAWGRVDAPAAVTPPAAAERDAQRRARAAAAASKHAPVQELTAFAWIGAFLPLVAVLGFYAGILFYVFCYLRLYGRKGAAASAGAAFGLVGFLFLVFDVLMGYEIFGGILGGDFL